MARSASHRDKWFVPFKKTDAKIRSVWSAATPGRLPVASVWGPSDPHHTGQQGLRVLEQVLIFLQTHPTLRSLPCGGLDPLVLAHKSTASPTPLSMLL